MIGEMELDKQFGMALVSLGPFVSSAVALVLQPEFRKLAGQIDVTIPDGPDKSAAVRLLREAMWTAMAGALPCPTCNESWR